MFQIWFVLFLDSRHLLWSAAPLCERRMCSLLAYGERGTSGGSEGGPLAGLLEALGEVVRF